ncbi:type 2 isopentenyl-diphosphate Delta-isomerase [Aureimonas mangrovi]|uniref:type 2 isopentenyl-diphosphate Delta-isomerase n=1 Tax=Aureimonas mangrovi TaxID=2758041 RepID=UPI002484547B|nr:type 2 isopentenyl-diphosphate Delta-isomerase [Aureimonas mangrovi]
MSRARDDSPPSGIAARKSDHLDIAMRAGQGPRAETGFAAIRFEHVALPEIDLDAIDLSTEFLGRRLQAPLLISSMTGGPERAGRINARLAEVAQALGIAFAVGSQRIAVEGRGASGLGRELRALAPSVPILANVGGAQLTRPGGEELARAAIDMIGADALIVHLNPLQEALQPEGDRDWRGVLAALQRLARSMPVPLVAKEVGAGLSGAVARRLVDAGVSVIDVAGAGGTSWAAIEAERITDPDRKRVAIAFADWGIPTAQAISTVRTACPRATVIGSGGVRTGIDAAKALRLGADLVGQAGASLAAADRSSEATLAHFQAMIEELRVACFCTGSPDLAALKKAPLLP